ncbi:MAG: radical SAM protein [Oscillospiraceae bacterium]|nr:radical SAM protein [Oscillospiraceae bacterium]
MYVERVIYPVSTLGPGKRIAVWVRGCTKKCEHCINPDLWGERRDKDIPVSQLLGFIGNIIDKNPVDGITLTGGDPLEQDGETLAFISGIHNKCPDILVYTGYTLSELDSLWTREKMTALKENAAVVIDGRYIHHLNDGLSSLRGSTNQQIHFFDEDLRPQYERYMRETGRQVQNFYYEDNLISVGIHNNLEG